MFKFVLKWILVMVVVLFLWAFLKGSIAQLYEWMFP
jgi:hypothetical protein